MAAVMWTAGPFRINRATMPLFAVCQILVVLLVTPLLSIPGSTTSLSNEMDILPSIFNQSLHQDETIRGHQEASSASPAMSRSGQISDTENDECQRQTYHVDDFNPNTTFPGTKIFHPSIQRYDTKRSTWHRASLWSTPMQRQCHFIFCIRVPTPANHSFCEHVAPFWFPRGSSTGCDAKSHC